MRHVPAECDNLLIMGDPLPHLERVLSSEGVRRLLTEGEFVRALRASDPTMKRVRPDEILQQIRANDRYVPTEAVVGMPAESLEKMAGLIRAALLLGLVNGARQAEAEDDVSKLQDELVAQVRELAPPRLTVWVSFRSPETPKQLLAQYRELVQQGRRHGLSIVTDMDAVGVAVKVSRLLPVETLAFMAVGFGVAEEPDDDTAAAVAEALGALNLEVWLERRENGLRMTLGPRPQQTQSIDPETLGPLWKPDESLLLFAHWETERFKQKFEETWSLWEKWRETPVGERMREDDTDDMLGNLQTMSRTFRQATPRGAMRIAADSSLRFVSRGESPPPAPALKETGLLTLIPPIDGLVGLDATRSLGDFVVGMLARFEDRLERNSLKYELGGQTKQAEMTESIRRHYYDELRDFRRLILDKAPEVFEPPLAQLFDDQGTVSNLLMAADTDSGRFQVTATDMPVPEYALIGRLREPGDRVAWVEDVWRSFVGSFVELPDEPLTEPVDLGLTVPTTAFRGGWLEHVPGNPEITVEGDLRPHYLVKDGWFVFSTSPRLSRLILSGNSGQNSGIKRLTSAEEGRVVACGILPGEVIAGPVNHVAEWIAALADPVSGRIRVQGVPGGDMPPQDIKQASQLVGGIAEIMRLIDQAEWQTVDHHNVRMTRFKMTFTGRQ